jgi:methyl-branched lipid omega-hydroxylase
MNAERAEVELDTIDLMDPEWFRDGPPHELFARMRAEAPVRWNETPGQGGFWSVTRHADIAAISRDTDSFSSHRAGIFLEPDQVVPLDLARNLLLYKDPPEHTKYRLPMQSAFVPHSVGPLTDDVRARVTRVIDGVVERGSCDFVKDIAVPVPLGVLAGLMGLPDTDMPRLYEWTEQIEKAQRSPEPAAAMETFAEMSGYLHEQIANQSDLGEADSLVMRLRRAEVDGRPFDDSEILVFFGLLVFAGNDTTRNTASSGMLALLAHPEQLTMLRDDPALVSSAIEEILRWTSVVNYFVRTATRATEIGGQKIREGDKVVIWYVSGSRDEEVYEDPQTFDISRTDQSHQAFGGGGRHFCLGAGLARLELRIVFEEVLRRMPDIVQAGEAERLRSSWANSLTSLPVRFAPGLPECLPASA